MPIEILDDVDLDSFRIQKTYEGTVELEKKDIGLPEPNDGPSGVPQEAEQDMLSAIIEKLNGTHGIELTAEDKVDLESIKKKLEEDEDLKAMMTADNTLANKKKKFDEMLDSMFLDFVHNKLDLYQKLTKPDTNHILKQLWFDKYIQRIEA